MPANFAFYVHHHGSGHLMRALSIASKLRDASVTFLGSGLANYADIIPGNIRCIHLPQDVAGPEDIFSSERHLQFLHYVPMNVKKVAARSAAVTAALHDLFPVILVVDVSVEVTILATLCGIPTVVTRQNGDRDDSAHLHAYECASLLIAPSSRQLMSVSKHEWVNKKTFFSGGFSKYSGRTKSLDDVDNKAVGVIVGSGGTSLSGPIINRLALQCEDRSIHVIGNIQDFSLVTAPNVVCHGQIQDPSSVLCKCGVVVGNAGHNTVMEIADLGKKFICIPEDRPFAEQVRKAQLLEKYGMAINILPQSLQTLDWQSVLTRADNLHEKCWQGVIDASALTGIASRLGELWEQNFPKGLS